MSLKEHRSIRKMLPEGSKELWRGKIVKVGGSTTVTDNPLFCWVKPEVGGQPLPIYNDSTPHTNGRRVVVGNDRVNRRVRVLHGVWTVGTTQTVNPNVGPHGESHGPEGADVVYIMDWQIIPLLVYPTTGMTVRVTSGMIVYLGQPRRVETEDIDLTSSIPGSGARYSLIRVSNTGVWSVQDGTPVASYIDLTDDDIPECEVGYAAIAFVRSYYGQTALSKLISDPDVKMLIWGGGLFDAGGGFSGFDDSEGDPVDVDETAAADGTSDYAARRDHRHHLGDHEHVEADITDLDFYSVEANGGTLNRISGAVTIIDDAKHNGFPILLRLSTGDLAVFYKQATSHAYDADSVVLMRTSDDNGVTWSAASTIASDDTYDVQPGGGVVLSTGRIVLMLNLNTISPDGAMADSTRIIYSDDDGDNWSAAYTINSSFTDWDHSTGGNIVELPDSTLRLALFGENTGDTYASVNIYTSNDEGETWGTEIAIADGESDSRNYQEPNLVQLQDGRLLIIMRSDTTPTSSSQFYKSISSDDGATWSTPEAMFVATGAPRLIQLINGLLLIVYRDASDLQADYRISRDNGYSWESAIALSTGATVQMSYASPIEYEEGMIGIAWGDEDADTNSDIYYCQLFTTVEGGQLVSNAPTGTAPLIVESTTVVTNLNADLLDGKHADEIGGGSADPTFYIAGILVTETEIGGAFIVPEAVAITKIYIHCEDPGSAGSTIVDINLNDVTIFTTQANRPELAYDDADGWTSGTPDVTNLVEGDVLTLDIDQIATGAGGLSVTVAFEKVEDVEAGARVYNNANLTIPNASATALTFNSEDYDIDGCHSTVTNTSRLTATIAGKYLVVGQLWWTANATGYRVAYILKNGTVVCQVADNAPDGTLSSTQNITTIVHLEIGQYVELAAYQSSTGNLDVRYLSDRTPYFMMQRI